MRTSKFVGICILVFLVSFIMGMITKLVLKPIWAKKYSVIYRGRKIWLSY